MWVTVPAVRMRSTLIASSPLVRGSARVSMHWMKCSSSRVSGMPGNRDIGRLIGGEGPLAAVLPHRVAVDGQLAFPWLDVVEHRHCLGADHGQPPLAIGIETRGEKMAAQAVGEAHVQMREVAEIVEQGGPLAAHLDRLCAGDRQDHRQIVRRQVPQRVVLCVELAEAEPVRVDVADFAKLALVDQPLQRLEGGVEPQDMANHEDAAIVLGRLHRTLGIRHRQRDRLFHQHVLAVLDGTYRKVGMELRRQRHDDGVDIVTDEQLVRLDRQAVLLAGKAFRAARLVSETACSAPSALRVRMWLLPQYPQPRTAMRGFICFKL